MVYVYKKVVVGKTYYYLRASKRIGKRTIAKDLAYLGSTLNEVRASLAKRQGKEIRKAYRTIKRFLQSNTYLELAKQHKIKHSLYINQDLLQQVEACQLHWQKEFQKLDQKTKQEFLHHFIIEFTFNTTSIEGNTITLREAAQLLIEHLTPKNKSLREIYDIQNTENVFLKLLEKPLELTHERIIELHRDLMQNIDLRGGYRTTEIHVIHSRFAATPAQYIKTDMGLLLQWYHKHKKILHPLVLATLFHHKFEKIHPFFDGNGRTGRILMNAILLKEKYPPLIIQKKHRELYLEALQKADAADLTDITPKNYTSLVEHLATEYIDIYWNNFLF